MFGYQLVRLCDEMKLLGLVLSREQFARSWCGRNPSYLHDYTRRDGAMARVSARTIERVRMRLAEASTLLPPDLADRVRAFDAMIERDLHIADLLGRRSVDARYS